MENENEYKELEAKYGPHTAELQRRFHYDKKYLGLLDFKLFIDDESIVEARANGMTTEQMVESIAKQVLQMDNAPTVPSDPAFF